MQKEAGRSVKHKTVFNEIGSKGFYDLLLLLSMSMPGGLCGAADVLLSFSFIHCACFNLTVAGALCM